MTLIHFLFVNSCSVAFVFITLIDTIQKWNNPFYAVSFLISTVFDHCVIQSFNFFPGLVTKWSIFDVTYKEQLYDDEDFWEVSA